MEEKSVELVGGEPLTPEYPAAPRAAEQEQRIYNRDFETFKKSALALRKIRERNDEDLLKGGLHNAMAAIDTSLDGEQFEHAMALFFGKELSVQEAAQYFEDIYSFTENTDQNSIRDFLNLPIEKQNEKAREASPDAKVQETKVAPGGYGYISTFKDNPDFDIQKAREDYIQSLAEKDLYSGYIYCKEHFDKDTILDAMSFIRADNWRSDVANAWLPKIKKMPPEKQRDFFSAISILSPKTIGGFWDRVFTQLGERATDNWVNIKNFFGSDESGLFTSDYVYSTAKSESAFDDNGNPAEGFKKWAESVGLYVNDYGWRRKSSNYYPEESGNMEDLKNLYLRGKERFEDRKLFRALRAVKRTDYDYTEVSGAMRTFENAAITGVEMLKYIGVGAAATFATKNPYVGIAASSSVMFMEEASDMYDSLVFDGNMPTDKAAAYAVLYGTTVAALEQFQITRFSKTLKGTSYLLNGNAAQKSLRGYFKHNLAELPKTYLREGGAETFAEFAQDWANFATKEWVAAHENATFDEQQLFEEYKEGFLETAKVMPTVMAFVSLFGFGMGANRARIESGASIKGFFTQSDAVNNHIRTQATIAQLDKITENLKKTAENIGGKYGEDFVGSYINADAQGRQTMLDNKFRNQEEKDSFLSDMELLENEQQARVKMQQTANKKIVELIAETQRKNETETAALEKEFQKISEAEGANDKRSLVDAFLDKYGGREDVVFVNSAEDLNELFSEKEAAEILQDIQRKGAYSHKNGKIYLFEPHFKDGVEAFRTLVHERLHWVADKIRLDPSFDGMLKRVLDIMGGGEILKQSLEAEYANLEDKAAAEEYIARVCERVAMRQAIDETQRGVFRTFKNWIKKVFGAENTFADMGDRQIADIANALFRRANRESQNLNSDSWRATTPEENGTEVGGKYEVVDASEIIASTDEGYDDTLQPRNRARRGSVEQVGKIATHLNPKRLDSSETTDDGAPIIDEKRQVLSGNGRTLAIRQAYANNPDRAREYRDYVLGRARQMGISVDPGIKNPVLVRRIDDAGGMSLQEFAARSNKQKVASMSNAETAVADARRILEIGADGGRILDLFFPSDKGDVLAESNTEFINAFLEAVGGRELYIDRNGRIKPNLAPRIRAAVLAAMLDPNKREIIESLLDNPEGWSGLIKGLIGCASNLGKLVGNADYDISAEMSDAVELFVNLRREGRTFKDYTSQTEMFEPLPSAEVSFLMELFEANVKTPTGISGVLNEYYNLVKNIDTTSVDMFGEGNPAKIAELQKAFERYAGSEHKSEVSWSVRNNTELEELNRKHRELYERYKNGDQWAYQDAAELVAEEARRNGYEVKVYHGTGSDGYNVAKADSSEVQYGEGYQAHGQGLYLAVSRDVAEGYKLRGGRRAFAKYDGKTLNYKDFGFKTESDFISDLYHLKEEFKDSDKTLGEIIGSIKEILPELNRMIADAKLENDNEVRDIKARALGDKIEEQKDKIKILEGYAKILGEGASLKDITIETEKSKGRVFDWFTNLNKENTIDESKRLSEQNPSVREGIIKAFKLLKKEDLRGDSKKEVIDYIVDKNPYGGEIYREMSRILDLKQDASNIFNRTGIKGITYEAPGEGRVYVSFEGGATVKLQDPFTFNDNGELIPLTERFNSQISDMRFSIRRKSGGEFFGDKDLKRQYDEVVAKYKNTPMWLKAPNGADTKLTKRQWVLVRTPNFKKWFGDWEALAAQNFLTNNSFAEISEDVLDSPKINIEDVLSYWAEKYQTRKTDGKKNSFAFISKFVDGNIFVDVKTVRATISKGAWGDADFRLKNKALACVGEVIENGIPLNVNENWKDRGYPSLILSAPVKIGANKYAVQVVVTKKDAERHRDGTVKRLNKAYVVDAINIEGLENQHAPFMQSNASGTVINRSLSPIRNTLQKIFSVNKKDVPKVVDENGEPLAVYHNSRNEFNAFEKDKIGSATDWGVFGKGFYFSPVPKELYGGVRYIVALSIKNPLIVDETNARTVRDAVDADRGESFTADLKQKGYDGVIFKQEGEIREIVALESEQIKAVANRQIYDYGKGWVDVENTSNVGTFSADNPDIRWSVRAQNVEEQIKTPEFKKWFKKSAVVDADGKPLHVYHGTNNTNSDYSRFTVFGKTDKGFRTGGVYFFSSSRDVAGSMGDIVYDVFLSIQNPLVIDAAGNEFGAIRDHTGGIVKFKDLTPAQKKKLCKAFDFAPEELEESYKPEDDIDLVQAGVIKRPEKSSNEWAKYAKENGYDGVIFKNLRDGADLGAMQTPSDVYAVFNSTQIKDATGANNGEFSEENPDIMWKITGSGIQRDKNYKRYLESSGKGMTVAQVKKFLPDWGSGQNKPIIKSTPLETCKALTKWFLAQPNIDKLRAFDGSIINLKNPEKNDFGSGLTDPMERRVWHAITSEIDKHTSNPEEQELVKSGITRIYNKERALLFVNLIETITNGQVVTGKKGDYARSYIRRYGNKIHKVFCTKDGFSQEIDYAFTTSYVVYRDSKDYDTITIVSDRLKKENASNMEAFKRALSISSRYTEPSNMANVAKSSPIFDKNIQSGNSTESQGENLENLLRQERGKNPLTWASIVLAKEIMLGRPITQSKIESLLPQSEGFDGSNYEYVKDRAVQIAETCKAKKYNLKKDLDQAVQLAESDFYWQKEMVDKIYSSFRKDGEEYGEAKAKVVQWLKDQKVKKLKSVRGYSESDFDINLTASILQAMEQEPARFYEEKTEELEEIEQAASSDGDFEGEISEKDKPILNKNIRDVISTIKREVLRRSRLADDGQALMREKYKKTLADVLKNSAQELSFGQEKERILAKIGELEKANYAVITIKDGDRAGQKIDNYTLRAEHIALRIFNRGVRDDKAELTEKLDNVLKSGGTFNKTKRADKRSISADAHDILNYARKVRNLGKEAYEAEFDAVSSSLELSGKGYSADLKYNEALWQIEVLKRVGNWREKTRAQMADALEWFEGVKERGIEEAQQLQERHARENEKNRAIIEASLNAEADKFYEDGKAPFSSYFNWAVHLADDLDYLAASSNDAARKNALALTSQLSREIYDAGSRRDNEIKRQIEGITKLLEEVYGENAQKALKALFAYNDKLDRFSTQKVKMNKNRLLQLYASCKQGWYTDNVLHFRAKNTKRGLEIQKQIAALEEMYPTPEARAADWKGYKQTWREIERLEAELKLEKQKAVGEFLKEIESHLDAKDLEFYNKVIEFWEREFEAKDKVNREITGFHLEHLEEFYHPVKVKREGGMPVEIYTAEVLSGSMMPRVKHNYDFDDRVGFIDMINDKIREGAHFKNFAALTVKLRGIFGDAAMQDLIRLKLGEKFKTKLLQEITDACALRMPGEKFPLAEWLNMATATMSLGLNWVSGFRQLTSVPAYMMHIGWKKFWQYQKEAFTNPEVAQAIKEICQSETFRRRVQMGNNIALEEMFSDLQAFDPNKGWGSDKAAKFAKWFRRWGLLFNKLGDVAPILLLGQGIYREGIGEYLARGKSLQEAKELAMRDMWFQSERTQQSAQAIFAPHWTRRFGTLGKLVSLFTSSPQLFASKVINSFNIARRTNSKADWKRFAEDFFISHILLAGGYAAATVVCNFLMGDGADEDDLKDVALSMLYGSSNGLFLFGRYASTSTVKDVMPMSKTIKTLGDAYDLIPALLSLDGEDIGKASNRLLKDIAPMYRHGEKVYKNLEKVGEGKRDSYFEFSWEKLK